MKKAIALVLVLVLVFSAAALAEMNIGVTVSDVVLNIGETYALNPSFTATVGANETSVWLEGSAAIDGEDVLVGQMELADNQLLISVDGANDVLVVNGLDEMLADQNTTTAEFISMVNSYSTVIADGTALASVIETFSGVVDGLTVEKLADMQYAIAYENEEYGFGVSMTLTISPEAVQDFVDLSAKTPVEVTEENIENSTMPESDVKTVAKEKMAVLMDDESVTALLNLFTGLFASDSEAA